MSLSILTPHNDRPYLAPVYEQSTAELLAHLGASGIACEATVATTPGANVCKLRRQCMEDAEGHVFLWLDADDWIDWRFVVAAYERMQRIGPVSISPQLLCRVWVDADGIGPNAVLPINRQPYMSGGMVLSEVARAVPYPEEPRPETPGDADAWWWSEVVKLAPHEPVRATQGVAEVVMPLFGDNLSGGDPGGLIAGGPIPPGAMDHLERLSVALRARRAL